MLKKLDIFLLKSYSGPLVATFFISVFVLLMQFLWKYIDELVGKGLDSSVILELMFYASISVIPMALPLAILLASIMTFGNLGEKYELTAIKAAGISLQRSMRPLIIVTFLVSIGAFYIANNLIPYSNLKMSSLLWSIKNQRPEMNIKPHVFNNDIQDFSIRISDKNPVTNMMYDFVVYDHTKSNPNRTVIVSDSGSMKMTADNRFMIVTLYNGVKYEEIYEKTRDKYPSQKDEFDVLTLVFNLSGFDFSRTDENLFRNNYQVKNINELERSTDSLQGIFFRRTDEISSSLLSSYYMKNSIHKERWFADSMYACRVHKSPATGGMSRDFISDADEFLMASDTAFMREDSIIRSKIAANRDSIYNSTYSIAPSKLKVVTDLDSLYQSLTKDECMRILDQTKHLAIETQGLIVRNVEDLSQRQKVIAKYRNAWHQKFTLSFACMIFFFIGAPLGAIIRKGGFGLPIVISIFVFLIYYIISTAGMKMSREGLWEPWQGMWLSSFIILPLGVFLTYKATIDAQLFNSESWANAFKEIGHFFVRIFKKLSDTGDSKEQHPLRNNLQVAAFICGGIGFGLAFTPMFLTSLTFAIAAIAMGVGVIFLNRKYNFKSKFATLAIAIGVAGLVFCLLNGNKRAKKHAQAVEEDMPQTEQVLQQ